MSDDLLARFAAAREETNALTLPDPATLRRAGTRRTRIRFGSMALAAFAAVIVVAVGANRLFLTGAPARPVQPGPSVTAGPSAPVVATPSAQPPSDPPDDDPCSKTPAACYPPLADALLERLPAPCATVSHPSNASIVVRRSEQKLGSSGGPVSHAEAYGRTLTRYRGDGAIRYLAEVRDAVRRCPSVTRGGIRYRYQQVRTGFAGDESVMLSRTYRTAGVAPGAIPKDTTFPIAVVRVADVVIVIYDYGWEGAPTGAAAFDVFVAEAIALARAGRP